MRVRLRLLLFAGFLAVIGVVVILVAATDGGELRAGALEEHRAGLERSLRLAELALDEPMPAPQPLAMELSRRTGIRVTLVDSRGVVLGESEVPPPGVAQIENHAGRPEIAGALGGEMTFARRPSGTTGVDLLYGAIPIQLGGETLVLRMAAPLDAVGDQVAAHRRGLQLGVLVAILLSFVLSHLLARAVTRPLEQLAGGTRDLADGRLDHRIPRRSRLVETDDVAHHFNRLAEELEGRVRSLTLDRDEMNALIDSVSEGVIALTEDARVLRINRAATNLLDVPRPLPFAPIGTLVRQPELRDLLESSVVRPLDAHEIVIGGRNLLFSSRVSSGGGSVITLLNVSELRRVERVRRDFVANASHEFKTPLTAMRGYAETLLDDDAPEEVRRRFLGAILDNTLRLQNLVNDLLDLSRLEAGAWSAEGEELELGDVAREVWKECIEQHGRAGSITFTVEGECILEGDRGALERIFRNLFENAVRYTPEGGRIGVEVRAVGGWVHVSVQDNGSGIPAAALPRVFERFYRADPARARVAGGSGLGLAIVRHLVSVMGGTVAAESELGRGTTIRFSLPLEGASAGGVA